MNKLLKIFLLFLFPFCSAFGASQLGVSVHDTTFVYGDVVEIPIYADSSFNGQNVLSYSLQLTFNSNLLVVDSVMTAGTISQGWGSLSFNNTVPGKITIAAAASIPLTGKGILLYIRMHAKSSGSSYLAFTDTVNNYFNEGFPRIKLKNGYFTIKAKPVITVNPNQGLLTVGETLQFNVSSGQSPYTWSVTNPSSASINTSGLLTAEHYGFTRVVAKDANNIIDTSNGVVEIRAFKLSTRDTTFYQGQMVDIPVYTTDLTGLNISSGQFSLSFNQNILNPVQVIKTGTLLQSFSDPVFKDQSGGKMDVSFAGSGSLTGAGVLLIIQFQITKFNTGSTALSFSNITFNENILGNSKNSQFSVIRLASLNIAPSAGTLIAGDTLRFKASNGTPPYNWTVSDTNLAKIDNTGLLTALKGGIVQVTANDLYGGSGKSGNITLYDTRVNIPDTNASVGDTIDVPIYVGNLFSIFSISSMQTGISFDSSIVKFDKVVTTGTFSDGWAFQVNDKGNQIIVAGAGSNSFGSQGVIVKLRFNISSKTQVGRKSSLTIQQFLLNEGSPAVLTKNGSILASSVSLPASPTGLEIDSTGYTKVYLNWADNANNESGYKIERSINNNGNWMLIDSLSENSTSFTDTGLLDGTRYYYRIFAYNIAGNSSYSNESAGATKLIPPYNLQAASTEANKIDLTWQDTSSSESGFIIERKLDETGTYSAIDSVAANVTSYLDSNLAVGTYYVYRVKAYNSLVQSDYSNEFGATVTKVGNNVKNIPGNFMIYQNYPNPFNPSTTIKYQIPSAALVQIAVYDLLGRKAATLVNGYQPAGYYEILFNASKLSSGIYFYKITAGKYNAIRKMILLK